MSTIKINAVNYKECHELALETSRCTPAYITVIVDFGEAMLRSASRLHQEAAGDYSGPDEYNGYYLNGKFKRFTAAQRHANDKAGGLV